MSFLPSLATAESDQVYILSLQVYRSFADLIVLSSSESFAEPQMAAIRSIENMRPRFANCRRCVLFMGRSVTLSLPVALFSSPRRTYQPLAQTIGVCMVAHGAGGLTSETLWKWRALGAGIAAWKFQFISSMFPPGKANFPASVTCSPAQLVSFWALYHWNGQP